MVAVSVCANCNTSRLASAGSSCLQPSGQPGPGLGLSPLELGRRTTPPVSEGTLEGGLEPPDRPSTLVLLARSPKPPFDVFLEPGKLGGKSLDPLEGVLKPGVLGETSPDPTLAGSKRDGLVLAGLLLSSTRPSIGILPDGRLEPGTTEGSLEGAREVLDEEACDVPPAFDMAFAASPFRTSSGVPGGK